MDSSSNLQNQWIVTEDLQGHRLDQTLAALCPEHSRAFLQKYILEGRVLVNQGRATAAQRVKIGDQIDIFWKEETSEAALQGEKIPLDILLEDDHIIVLNKPAGLVVHPGSGNATGTLVQGLLFHAPEAFSEMDDSNLRPGIVHRLDKDTSGVLIVAKNSAAESQLKESFKNHLTKKKYLAIALGHFQEKTGEISGMIGRHPSHRQKMAVLKRNGKPAFTRYKVLGEGENCSLLEVEILTGRTHQIRVHLAHIRHPVLGDPLYGGRPATAPMRPERQLLHAWQLTIPHPVTGELLQCQAPLPADFQNALTQLRLELGC